MAVVKAIRVRSARQDEATVLLELWRAAGAEPRVGEDAFSVRRLLDQQPSGVLVAECDGAVVGSLIAKWDGWRGNMYRLAVLPSYRRRGIARALVEEGERRLRDQGCARVSAIVMREHDWAVGFWRAVTYTHDERVFRFVRNMD